MAGRLRAWLRVYVCKCVRVCMGGGVVHAWLCPFLRVRVSLSVCESLQQMLPPPLANHLTPAAALDFSLRVGRGHGGLGGGWAGMDGMEREREGRDGRG